MIPKSECKDRTFYRIRSRNLTFGVFCVETGGFIGLREKFDQIYLFEEYHHDDGPPYGTVTPLEELEELPAEINSVAGSSVCQGCGAPVAYITWPEGGSRDVKLKSGGTVNVTGRWEHLAETKCDDLRACHRENQALRKWIEEASSKYFRKG